jgi:sulfate permease, SulP family
MSDRIGRTLRSAAAFMAVRPGGGLRDAFRDGYGAADFRADAFAGLVTGLVALPLSMALSSAAGAPPVHGLYTAIVAGATAGLLGASRAQISGPTNNFVILAPIAAAHGVGGLVCASMMAGVLLIVFSAARLGRLIQFIPFTVTQGFTSAIGCAIAVLQLRDLLGLPIDKLPIHVFDQVPVLFRALPQAQAADAATAALTLAVLVFWPKFFKRIPAPLVALLLAGFAAEAGRRFVPGFSVATIGSRFGGMSGAAPSFQAPWSMPGPDGRSLEFDFDLMRALFPAAFAIALLVSIESLLSSVVADALMGTSSDPDAEILAQGAGNVVAAFFGGFGATGALARTVTNVRAGARSPISALVHSAFLLAIALFLAPWISYLPMAALAALLLLTAWNLFDARYLLRLVRLSPRHDVVVLAVCFALTLLFDMEVGVTVGVTLASLLFMRRMAESTLVKTVAAPLSASGAASATPAGVTIYEVAGPFFFGAAAKLVGRLKDVLGRSKALIIDVGAVPFIDATGLINLGAMTARLRSSRTPLLLARLSADVELSLRRAGIVPEPGVLEFHDSVASAVEAAARLIE